MAISPGHQPTPFHHTARTVRWKRKFIFYLGTASSGTSSIPLPATYSRHRSWSSQLGRRKFRQTQSRASASAVPSDCSISKLTLHHHAKQQLSNADTKVQSIANSRHCIRRVINFCP
ncbi:hypothetical protein AVEN_32608-1 [Araneus ventricosus]|uniref:Uncharacterized protein n=1 Tax=Araneus ventricosus TaxID=182803 RepID=A0A4Y2C891_ARAVE|nr:hypothetical protein AVEN_32608-1 [Araneus ventricosus]